MTVVNAAPLRHEATLQRFVGAGYTHDQIAALTGVARSQVTTHLRRIAIETNGQLRCPQCWKLKAVADFENAAGAIHLNCNSCRERARLPWEERNATRVRRYNLRTDGDLRVSLSMRSGNRKLGPIPVSITSSETCPPSCAFFGEGCFAEYHLLRSHWARVPERGRSWEEFCELVALLPAGALWRHNAAGDLPGRGEELDAVALMALVAANRGRRGFTFTHKPMGIIASAAIRVANELGFTVNLSADNLDHADRLADLDVGPVVVVVPSNAPEKMRTLAGRHVIVCPAETKALTCATCALCAKPQRKAIVAFRAHGQLRYHVDGLVQLRVRGASPPPPRASTQYRCSVCKQLGHNRATCTATARGVEAT